jgi:hypothetical protein
MDTEFAPRYLSPLMPILTWASTEWILETSTLRPTAVSMPTGCARTLRPLLPRRFRDQDALPPIASGAQHPKILDLVGRQSARGRPRHRGRLHFLYRVRFPDLDHHYDVWLTEKTLRQLSLAMLTC